MRIGYRVIGYDTIKMQDFWLVTAMGIKNNINLWVSFPTDACHEQ